MKIEATFEALCPAHSLYHHCRGGQDNCNGWRKGRHGEEGEKEDGGMGNRMGR